MIILTNCLVLGEHGENIVSVSKSYTSVNSLVVHSLVAGACQSSGFGGVTPPIFVGKSLLCDHSLSVIDHHFSVFL